MGYTKIVQYGNVTEVYQYEKNLNHNKKRHDSQLAKKRRRQARLQAKAKGIYERSKRSIRRSQQNFFRMTHHNNINATTIHFLTLTFIYDLSYKTSSRHVAHFMERLKKSQDQIPISYVSVPELTKEGRYHFHLLVYDLPPETASIERETRDLQRQFRRGYIDICLATYTSEGIAGYMAKYMAKALSDEKIETARGYNCSRNIKKITSHGSNSLLGCSDVIIPTLGVDIVQESSYDVPYLGKCSYKKIIE